MCVSGWGSLSSSLYGTCCKQNAPKVKSGSSHLSWLDILVKRMIHLTRCFCVVRWLSRGLDYCSNTTPFHPVVFVLVDQRKENFPNTKHSISSVSTSTSVFTQFRRFAASPFPHRVLCSQTSNGSNDRHSKPYQPRVSAKTHSSELLKTQPGRCIKPLN